MDTLNEVQTNKQDFMSASIAKLAEALSKAQGAMEAAKKDSANPFFKSNYADLNSVIQAAKEPLKNNGLSVTQLIEPDTQEVRVTTLLLHSSGEWLKSTIAIRPVKADPQGMGSAISYARRYAYQSIIGLSAEDDDGNKASRGTAESSPQQAARTQALAQPDKINDYQKGEIHRIISEQGITEQDWLTQHELRSLDELSIKEAGDIIMADKARKGASK